jgi:hypothetical protein
MYAAHFIPAHLAMMHDDILRACLLLTVIDPCAGMQDRRQLSRWSVPCARSLWPRTFNGDGGDRIAAG